MLARNNQAQRYFDISDHTIISIFKLTRPLCPWNNQIYARTRMHMTSYQKTATDLAELLKKSQASQN